MAASIGNKLTLCPFLPRGKIMPQHVFDKGSAKVLSRALKHANTRTKDNRHGAAVAKR